VNVLRKERARVKNILYAGLTKKQEKELIELQKQRAIEAAVKEAVEQAVEQAVEETVAKTTAEVQLADKIKTVDDLVEQNILTLDKACDFMKLPVEEYLKYKQN
jgi:methyl coenzyme M reductase beta subunit